MRKGICKSDRQMSSFLLLLSLSRSAYIKHTEEYVGAEKDMLFLHGVMSTEEQHLDRRAMKVRVLTPSQIWIDVTACVVHLYVYTYISIDICTCLYGRGNTYRMCVTRDIVSRYLYVG